MLKRIVKQVLIRAVHARNESTRRRLGLADATLPPQTWGFDVGPSGHLTVDGCDAVEMAERFGTPLHIVSQSQLEKTYRRFLGSFAAHYPHVEIGYSYKTNPLPGVLRALHDIGALAEVISHFELWLAQVLGVPPERTIFNGPAKTPAALELAVSSGIRLINFDNLDEIETTARLAEAYGRTQEVGVRLVTSVGWSSQFGLSVAQGDAREAFARIARYPRLVPSALHIHLGTGIKSIATYAQAVREVLDFAAMLLREMGIRMKWLDLGGGFGVPTVRAYSEWDQRLTATGYPPAPIDVAAAPTLEAYGREIGGLVRSYYPSDRDLPTLIFEPGRAITSSAQLLLMHVLAVKSPVSGAPRVILDGGRHSAYPTGYEHHELLPASKMRAPFVGPYNFYGPLCHPGDVFHLWKRFPELGVGDVVALMDSGAYFIPNQMNFSNPRAAAVMADRGEAHVIRAHESFADVVRLDLGLPAARGQPIEGTASRRATA